MTYMDSQSPAQEKPVPFLPFEKHGVSVSFNTQRHWLCLRDTSNAETVVGHTAIDRHKLYLDRLSDVSLFLATNSGIQLHGLIGPSSIGLEPLSLEKTLLDKNQQGSVRLSALDVNSAFIDCMNERKLPQEAVEHISEDETWQTRITYNNDGSISLDDALYDAVSVVEPQSITDYHDSCDMVSTFHLLYHLPRESQAEIIRHLCGISSAIVAIDKGSYEKEKTGISYLMEDCGFANLNGRINPEAISSGGVYEPQHFGEGIIFCKNELVSNVTQAMRNQTSWQSVQSNHPAPNVP